MARNIPEGGLRGDPVPRWDLIDVGGAGTLYEVTVHDPACLSAVVAVLDRLQVRVPLVRAPTLKILEVAMDVIPRVPGTVDLARVVADLFKGAKFEPSGNSRLVKGKHFVDSVLGPDAVYRRLRDGWTVYTGDSDDPSMIRGYVKRTDNKLDLPPDEHRARFEVQLQHDALPVVTAGELGSYRFEDLSPLFLMWTVNASLSPGAAALARALPKLRRFPRTVRVARHLATEAFAPFNKRAYRALQRLTLAMQNQNRSPYHGQHLGALRDHSVSADSFFHPACGRNPQPVQRNRWGRTNYTSSK